LTLHPSPHPAKVVRNLANPACCLTKTPWWTTIACSPGAGCRYRELSNGDQSSVHSSCN
jgi:hypothetical protein